MRVLIIFIIFWLNIGARVWSGPPVRYNVNGEMYSLNSIIKYNSSDSTLFEFIRTQQYFSVQGRVNAPWIQSMVELKLKGAHTYQIEWNWVYFYLDKFLTSFYVSGFKTSFFYKYYIYDFNDTLKIASFKIFSLYPVIFDYEKQENKYTKWGRDYYGVLIEKEINSVNIASGIAKYEPQDLNEGKYNIFSEGNQSLFSNSIVKYWDNMEDFLLFLDIQYRPVEYILLKARNIYISYRNLYPDISKTTNALFGDYWYTFFVEEKTYPTRTILPSDDNVYKLSHIAEIFFNFSNTLNFWLEGGIEHKKGFYHFWGFTSVTPITNTIAEINSDEHNLYMLALGLKAEFNILKLNPYFILKSGKVKDYLSYTNTSRNDNNIVEYGIKLEVKSSERKYIKAHLWTKNISKGVTYSYFDDYEFSNKIIIPGINGFSGIRINLLYSLPGVVITGYGVYSIYSTVNTTEPIKTLMVRPVVGHRFSSIPLFIFGGIRYKNYFYKGEGYSFLNYNTGIKYTPKPGIEVELSVGPLLKELIEPEYGLSYILQEYINKNYGNIATATTFSVWESIINGEEFISKNFILNLCARMRF